MNSGEKPTNLDAQSGKTAKSRVLVLLLTSLVGLESLFVLAGALYFFSQLFVQEVSNVAGAIVIFVISLLIAIGLAFASIGTLREKGSAKGAIITWQVLQFAVSTSFIQGIIEWQILGWLLMVLSLATLVLFWVTFKNASLEV